MRPTSWTYMVVVATALTAALADPPRGKARQRPAASRQEVDPFEAVRALRIEVSEINLNELPFDEFAQWLSRQSGVNVVPRWQTLERAGVERDAPITLKLKQVNLGEALRAVLTQLEEDHAPLGFRAHSNIVTISTKADLDRQLIVRTYDVQDLLVLVPSFQTLPLAGVPVIHGNRETGAKNTLKNASDDVRHLVGAIQDSVYPDSWKERGGSGTITFYRGHLVVRNTPEVHDVLSGQLRVPPAGP